MSRHKTKNKKPEVRISIIRGSQNSSDLHIKKVLNKKEIVLAEKRSSTGINRFLYTSSDKVLDILNTLDTTLEALPPIKNVQCFRISAIDFMMNRLEDVFEVRT